MGLGFTLIQCELVLINHICKDPISKQGELLRPEVDMKAGVGGHLSTCSAGVGVGWCRRQNGGQGVGRPSSAPRWAPSMGSSFQVWHKKLP